MRIKAINIKKLLITILWFIIGAGTVVLSVAAMKRQNEKTCKGISVSISGVNNNFFIDKNDVIKIINDESGGKVKGKVISAFNLRRLEAALKEDIWINNAELFFDNNDILQANIDERAPVARIFTINNNTFYIDSAATMLPLSDRFSARLPVFTGFTSEAKVLSKADSNLLFDIRKISIALQADSFLMAMVDQVDIARDRTFELTPKIGKQTIFFGDATDAELKFRKLKIFYKEVIQKTGWNKYSSIDLRYKNQIVAKVMGKEDVAADSLRTIQLLDFAAKNAATFAVDSARKYIPAAENAANDVSAIQQSVERDEGPAVTEDNYPVLPVPKPPVTAPVITKAAEPTIKKVLLKPVIKKIVPVEKNTVKKVTPKPLAVVKKPVTMQKKILPPAKPKAKMLIQKRNDY